MKSTLQTSLRMKCVNASKHFSFRLRRSFYQLMLGAGKLEPEGWMQSDGSRTVAHPTSESGSRRNSGYSARTVLTEEKEMRMNMSNPREPGYHEGGIPSSHLKW